MAKTKSIQATTSEALALRHTLVGWSGLLVFLGLGILLEVFHGLKLDLYLDVRQETRRFMWSLAHAHGTLFSLVQLGFAWAVVFASRWQDKPATGFQRASWALIGGLILLPLGFLLGGIWTYGGDPSVGILLVPVGALLMLFGVGNVVAVFFSLQRRIGKRSSLSKK